VVLVRTFRSVTNIGYFSNRSCPTLLQICVKVVTNLAIDTNNDYICNMETIVKRSVSKEIEDRILSKKDGEVFVPSDFNDLGGIDAVKTTLSRLAKEGVIRRIAQGIYDKPKKDPEIGALTPTIEIVAKAIARRDNAKIEPSGVMAMYLLGLTTQIPMKAVYLTDGSPREIHIGNRTIKFKSASPKLLSFEGEISKLVILALKELGESNLTNETIIEKLKSILKKEDEKKFENDRRKAPGWIGSFLKTITNENNKLKGWNF